MKPAKPLWRVTVATSLEAEDAVMELLGSLLGSPATAYFNLETRASLVSVYSEKPFAPQLPASISAGLKQIKNCGLQTRRGEDYGRQSKARRLGGIVEETFPAV